MAFINNMQLSLSKTFNSRLIGQPLFKHWNLENNSVIPIDAKISVAAQHVSSVKAEIVLSQICTSCTPSYGVYLYKSN